MVVWIVSTLGLPSVDLRSEWGRLNTGLGVVGTGGLGMGLGEREWGFEEWGELWPEVDIAGFDS